MVHPCVFSKDEPCDGEPHCLQNEVVVFSKFGHTVCHCNSDHYPLADLSLFTDLPKDQRCFKLGDTNTCTNGQSLWLKKNDLTHLECIEEITPLCAVCRIQSNPCPPGRVFAFGSCRKPRQND